MGLSGVEHMVSQWQTLGFLDFRATQTAIPINKPSAKSKSKSELILVSALNWKKAYISLNVLFWLNTLLFCTAVYKHPL